jgi:hypothetical protein
LKGVEEGYRESFISLRLVFSETVKNTTCGKKRERVRGGERKREREKERERVRYRLEHFQLHRSGS